METKVCKPVPRFAGDFAGSACGDGAMHCVCRQFGFCLFGSTPVDVECVPEDKFNAVCSAAGFWAFVGSSAYAASLYTAEEFTGAKLEPLYPTFALVWPIVIGINALTCGIFPFSSSILICNLFKATIIANQAWNVPMLMAAIAFYMRSYEGYAFMMFGMGWSVAMFYQQNVLFRFDKSPLWWLPYAPSVLFIAASPFLAMTTAASEFQTAFFVACWFFGFTVWTSMEGYVHWHPFGGAPDARLNAYTGPAVLTFPPKHECPTAWNDSNKAK